MKKFFILTILLAIFLGGCSWSQKIEQTIKDLKEIGENYEGMTPAQICEKKGGIVKKIEVTGEEVEICDLEGKKCVLNAFSQNICKDIETGEVEIANGTKFCGVKFSHCECKEICVEEVIGEEGWQDCEQECALEEASDYKAVCTWQEGECIDIAN